MTSFIHHVSEIQRDGGLGWSGTTHDRRCQNRLNRLWCQQVLWPHRPIRPTPPQHLAQSDLCPQGLSCNPSELRGHIPRLCDCIQRSVSDRNPRSISCQLDFSCRHKQLHGLRIPIKAVHQVSYRQIGDREVLCQQMLPRRSAGRIAQDVGLPSNPHPDKVELLEL